MMFMRLVLAFILHRGRMSCSAAAGSICSETVHRGEFTRFLAQVRWRKYDSNEPLVRALMAKESLRGTFLFIVDGNRLDQVFVAQKPNLIWLTDFTYNHTSEGFTYLCTVQDLFSRKIIGWATSQSIDTQLALAAFNQAFTFRRPEARVVLHSDRGSQCASLEYRKRLLRCNCLQSMSRKGNCYDNAPMESFFKSYKSEEVTRQAYQTHEHATRGTVDYIDRSPRTERFLQQVSVCRMTETLSK